jgi:hypothetical protein
MIRALTALFKALARQIVAGLERWLERRERDALVRTEAETRNDLEDLTHDIEKAERITRAVDALRTDGTGGVRKPASAGKPDTRGYRD